MNKHNPVHDHYFPHIDGLRTIAVVAVVLYHIFGYLCPGGYVGVDIFFVISGYLITGGIMKSLEKGTYSLKDFYTKRIRRIIPAYVAIVVFVLSVSVVIYAGYTLDNIFRTICYSSVFSANIFFAIHTGGYFDSGSEINPLLHLWSLGVEEQFYIFIPLIIAFLYRRKPRYIFFVTCCFFILSLLLSLYCNYTERSTLNFYLLPTRAWELLGGSLLALSRFAQPTLSGRSVWGCLGLVLCVAPCYFYDNSTLFPGITAIPLVIGALLLIKFGSIGLPGKLLKSRPFVFIGQLSYSLYLWHWPLMAFWNYLTDYSANVYGLSTVLFLSFLLGYLSWRYIEMPVRLMKGWNFRKAFILTSLSCSILIIISIFLAIIPSLNRLCGGRYSFPKESFVWHEGKPSKIIVDPNFPMSISPITHTLSVLGKDENPSFVLIGDSHASTLAPGFHDFGQKTGINGLYINRYYQLAVNTITTQLPKNDKNLDMFLNWLSNQHCIKYVILSNAWFGRFSRLPGFQSEYEVSSQNYAMTQGLKDLCSQIKSMNKAVIIIAPLPIQNFDVYEKWSKFSKLCPKKLNTLIGCNVAEYNDLITMCNSSFTDLKLQKLCQILDIKDYFFNNETQNCPVINNGKLLYVDSNHISPSNAINLLRFYSSTLRGMLLIKNKNSCDSN